MSEQKEPVRPGQVPTDMKAFNQKLIEEFRANHGRLVGPMAKSQLLLLTTKGAKSGQAHTTVIGYRPHGDRYLVIASGNAAPAHPQWYRNLLANPLATVEVGPDKFKALATTARPEERDELTAKIDYLERQQKLTEREIPIVILERVKA